MTDLVRDSLREGLKAKGRSRRQSIAWTLIAELPELGSLGRRQIAALVGLA